ncbi:hypothetical protein CHARACLAT_019027 [Characodon lateralis]|uniref:Uncharacterized protein n=1 Tax=Characodon lateralis TaxID=208331 RepID=A0ABU7EKZ9_9TELE|nr:hypothetical protein [Characodon lateralis]
MMLGSLGKITLRISRLVTASQSTYFKELLKGQPPREDWRTVLFNNMMLSEVLQVLRGAGKVGCALVTTQGEQLRLMACNSSVGAGLKAAQDVAEGLVATFMGSTDKSIKEDVFPDAEGWENMDPDEAAKWAVGSEFAPGAAEQSHGGVGPTAGMHTGTAPGGTGWPGQSTRFLHTLHSRQHFSCQRRSVHDTVVAKLTPEDIKKAREAKQVLVKPVRQKVGLKTAYAVDRFDVPLHSLEPSVFIQEKLYLNMLLMREMIHYMFCAESFLLGSSVI